MLENQSTVFKIDSDSSPKVVFLKEGDEVSFKANLLDNAKIATIDDMTIKGLK